jgi:hypothetical protein
MKAIVLFFAALQAYAHVGSFTGNGADRKGPGQGSAWFLGDRPVKWCANSEAVKTALENAVAKWQAYLGAKRVNDALNAPLPFALHFEKQASCEGADLLIEVSEDKGANTFSGSEVLEQDLMHGWSKGRIWLSKRLLANSRALETQLLHQLGHILGNDHVGGTVMAEDVANVSESPSLLANIDGTRELYICPICAVDLVGANGTYYREENGAAVVNGIVLQFTAELARADHGDAKLFSVALGSQANHLSSLSLARLAVAIQNGTPQQDARDGTPQQIVVRRNFDKRLEADLLVNGHPQRIFEATE